MKMVLKDGKRKVLTLSYDDGVFQDERLVKIMDKYGIKGTFNINTASYGQGRRMTHSQAMELYKNSGHEVAVHAYTHPFLEKLDSTEVIYEIIEDRKNIEKDYGIITRGMAYPFGTYSDEVVDILAKCGIVYSRTVKSTNNFHFPENWLTLHPTCHHRDPKLMGLAKTFVEKDSYYGQPMMFYLWGHSYEFDDHDNWNVIEEFCEYMGGRKDVWYATNIEIYDYVKAYKNLQTSYDKSIIHNPSAIDVWADIDGNVYCIKAGETLVL